MRLNIFLLCRFSIPLIFSFLRGGVHIEFIVTTCIEAIELKTISFMLFISSLIKTIRVLHNDSFCDSKMTFSEHRTMFWDCIAWSTHIGLQRNRCRMNAIMCATFGVKLTLFPFYSFCSPFNNIPTDKSRKKFYAKNFE